MSPLTAFFLGVFGLGAVAVAAGATVILCTLRIVDHRVGSVLGFAEHTIADLPEIIDRLPQALGDVLEDRRAPDYAPSIKVSVDFIVDETRQAVRPALTVINQGGEVVSVLSVHLAALDGNARPLCEWTEVVATPLAINDDWRGPLMPGATRYVVAGSRSRCLGPIDPVNLKPAIELSDIRVWNPTRVERTSAHAMTTP
jgi:hypothetical protein